MYPKKFGNLKRQHFRYKIQNMTKNVLYKKSHIFITAIILVIMTVVFKMKKMKFYSFNQMMFNMSMTKDHYVHQRPSTKLNTMTINMQSVSISSEYYTSSLT